METPGSLGGLLPASSLIHTFSISTPEGTHHSVCVLGFSHLSQDLALAFSIPSWDPLALPRASRSNRSAGQVSMWLWPGSRCLHLELPKVCGREWGGPGHSPASPCQVSPGP